MLDFVKRFFGSEEPKISQIDSAMLTAVESLDIQLAKAAHENWKHHLQAYLDGSSAEEFSAESICFDNRCDLGQWIYGTGKARLGNFPGFTALLGHHKMFHYAASNVVALAKAGKEDEANAMLNGQFAKFSNEVLADLNLLEEVGSARKKTNKAR
jgi:hypothetical protein